MSEEHFPLDDASMYANLFSFTGLPMSRDLSDAGVGAGIPYDLATSGRAGARGGPNAIRQASANVGWEEPRWPWDFDLRERLRAIDYGDIRFVWGDSDDMLAQVRDHAARITAAAGGAESDAVIREIRGLGIEGMDIETFGFTLRPEYEVSRDGSGTRTISGYRVQNNIRVMLPDVDATGRVLDRAVEAGANRVANLQFEASDTRGARLEALQQAVRSAREQAEVIASAMGVHLGPALEVTGGANAPSPFSPAGMMFSRAAEATTPVEAGDHLVTASVSIKFRIREGGS